MQNADISRPSLTWYQKKYIILNKQNAQKYNIKIMVFVKKNHFSTRK